MLLRTVIAGKPWWRAGMMSLCLACPASVLAHAHLMHSVPAADSQSAQVRELRLQFSEAVEAKLCTVRLQDREDRNVVEPAAEAVAEHPDALIVRLFEPLAPGKYTVQWNVVSADGHRMKGQYHFLVSR